MKPPKPVEVSTATQAEIYRFLAQPNLFARLDAREHEGVYFLSWKSRSGETGVIVRTMFRDKYLDTVALVLALKRGEKREMVVVEPTKKAFVKTLVWKQVESQTERRREYLAETGR